MTPAEYMEIAEDWTMPAEQAVVLLAELCALVERVAVALENTPGKLYPATPPPLTTEPDFS